MAALHVPVTPKDHIAGDEHASVILVEYGDYECPHCGHAYPIVKRVQKHFGKRLAFVYRNFPLNEIHPNAESAAEAAEFAAAHKRFWEMHDAIFENQDSLSPTLLLELGQTFELSREELESALTSGEYTPRVKEDFLGGVRSGVNGTPSLFVNGRRYDGPRDPDSLMALFKRMV